MNTALEVVGEKEVCSMKLLPCTLVAGFTPSDPLFNLRLQGGEKEASFYEVVIADKKDSAKKVYAYKQAQEWKYLHSFFGKEITGFWDVQETSLGDIIVLESGSEKIYISKDTSTPLVLQGKLVTGIRSAYELSTGDITEFELADGEKNYIQEGHTETMRVEGVKIQGFNGWKPQKTALGNVVSVRLEGWGKSVYIREGELSTVIKINNKIVTDVVESFETSQGQITQCKLENGEKVYVLEGEDSVMKIDGKKVTRVSASFGTKENALGLITEFNLEDESIVFLREGEKKPIKIVGKDIKDIGRTVDTALGLITYFTLIDDSIVLMRQGEENPFSLNGSLVKEVESMQDTSIGKISKFELSDGISYYIRAGEEKPFLLEGQEIIDYNNVGNGTLFTLITGKNIFIPEIHPKDTISRNTLESIGKIIGDSDE